MPNLTNEAQQQVRNIAQRYGVSVDAAENLLDALQRGSGAMAQFNHPDLGGYGQWMRGGMIMVGDMFNNGLKATVDGLCNELARLLETNPFVPTASSQSDSYGGSSSGNWWPAELGQPNSSGSQNDMRYAYFGGSRRLAIQQNGNVTIYDTGDHQIGGVSQQQGSGYSLAFTSQFGTVDLRQLPLVSSDAPSGQPYRDDAQWSPQAPSSSHGTSSTQPSGQGHESEHDIFSKIEKLAALRQKGLISEEEFASKKSELLARL
jgi:hypothetical protein